MSSASTGWLSYHLLLRAPHEPFLAGHLAPWLEREVQERRVKRFFFIRYGPDGGHLRFRVLPYSGIEPARLRAGLEAAVCDHLARNPDAGTEPCLEEHPYSRTLHYFGENRASVYAELLNQATSQLCLRIVIGPGGDRQAGRWLMLLSVLNQLLRGAARGDGDFADMVEEGRSFARRGSEAMGVFVQDGLLPGHPVLDATAGAALARGAAAANDPLVRRIVRLLCRVRDYVPEGGTVATHALHLLCNKLGFSLREEYDLFTALQRLAPLPEVWLAVRKPHLTEAI
jgi:thiopeptide-type bacteriocin biosynthesis protein